MLIYKSSEGWTATFLTAAFHFSSPLFFNEKGRSVRTEWPFSLCRNILARQWIDIFVFYNYNEYNKRGATR
jgi:hypothetical protein